MADFEAPQGNRVLLVEGQDDKHAVLHLCNRSQPMPLFDISDKGDINSLLDSIGPEIEAPGRIAVGILPDANDDPDARWNALRYRLGEHGLHLPQHREPNGTIVGDSPRVGIWLWPDNRRPGELEDFVEAMIPRHDAVWPLAQAYVDGIPQAERRFPVGKTLKAQLHAWLATRRTPGRMGSAIRTCDLEVDGPVAERFADWLRRLFS